jgi:hypothetical protein
MYVHILQRPVRKTFELLSSMYCPSYLTQKRKEKKKKKYLTCIPRYLRSSNVFKKSILNWQSPEYAGRLANETLH